MKNETFFYKGRAILESKQESDYYKVFHSLYSIIPEGGFVPYSVLIKEIKSRIPRLRERTDESMRAFIQGNLTSKENGFPRYAKVPKTEDGGKSLISIRRGQGIDFNNSKN